MVFLFAAASFSLTVHGLLLLMNAAPSLTPLTKWCLAQLPENSAHPQALASLICGQNVKDPDLREQLRQTALLHLFVVSGAHLIALENSLRALRLPPPLRRLAGAAFALMSGGQPPVVRAFIALCLPGERSSWGPRSRADLEVLKAGMLTLALIPAWISSLSLALSWAAAWALSLPLGSGWQGAAKRGLAIWLALAPLLAPWGVAAPISWLMNLLVGPVFAAVSLPLALVALPGGWFVIPFDGFMDVFMALIKALSDPSQIPESHRPFHPVFFWIWILALQLGSHTLLVTLRRTS